MCTLSSETPRWFAIVTKYKCEKSVLRALTIKGVKVCVPQQEIIRQHGSRKRKLTLPVISCYAFVKITSREYVKVLETENVARFVSFNKKLISIPDEEIEMLKRIADGYSQPVASTPLSYQKGDEVEIVSGRLTGLKGSLISIQGKRKFVVELKNMGFSLHLQVEPKNLRKAIY